MSFNKFPIFKATGVLPAPPTTIFPIQITGIPEGVFLLTKFLILVPNLNSNESGYKEFDKYVSFFLYQNLGALSILINVLFNALEKFFFFKERSI